MTSINSKLLSGYIKMYKTTYVPTDSNLHNLNINATSIISVTFKAQNDNNDVYSGSGLYTFIAGGKLYVMCQDTSKYNGTYTIWYTTN